MQAMRAISQAPKSVLEFYSWAWPDTRFAAGDYNRETTLTVIALYADAIRRLEARSTDLLVPPINPPTSL